MAAGSGGLYDGSSGNVGGLLCARRSGAGHAGCPLVPFCGSFAVKHEPQAHTRLHEVEACKSEKHI